MKVIVHENFQTAHLEYLSLIQDSISIDYNHKSDKIMCNY
jgi:hypothetical protein